MKLGKITLALIMGLSSAVGCDMTVRAPGSRAQDYPVIVPDSSDRRENAERAWRRMLDEYNLAPTPPDLYPIIYTPRSLLGVSGGIKILSIVSAGSSKEMALKEAAKGFIERWKDLIGADPSGVSLVSATPHGDSIQLVYKQGNYPFDLAGDYGEMSLTVSADGRLTHLDDRFIPVVQIPVRPTRDRAAAAKLLAQRLPQAASKPGQKGEASKKGGPAAQAALVVVATQKSDGLEVRLAWEFRGTEPAESPVYVDAMQGIELRTAASANP